MRRVAWSSVRERAGRALRALPHKAGVAGALAALVVAGSVVALAAPGHSHPSGTDTAQIRTSAPSLVADANTPTDTPPATITPAATGTATVAPQPTATPPPTPQPTATPLPPRPTATPAPTWHTVGGLWSGSSAGTAGKATVGSYPIRLVYTCAVETPAWAMEIGFMSDLGAGWTTANTKCDGASHTLDMGTFHDNPGGNGTGTFTVSADSDPAYNQTVVAWTLTVEVLS